MNTLNKNNSIKNMIKDLFSSYQLMEEIVHAINTNNGTSFLVGGAVRDYFLDRPIHDVDVEVHGLNAQQLLELLSTIGPVHKVGVSFGIFSVEGCPVQWSLPRTDEPGRKPTVHIDPTMTINQACLRRDLTMNAMAINLITGELIDPCNGLRDCHDKILRTPNPDFFIQDPLRFYRVMQFIGRFEMTPDDTLTSVCRSMDLTGISRERIEQEMEKLLLFSRTPSQGILWLRTIDRLDSIFPEIYALIGVPQNPQWHPEGDAFVHTLQALDASCTYVYPDKHTTLAMRYAALCHDFGKVVSTCLRNGKWTSYGHAITGVPIARTFLHRITRNHDLIKKIEALTLNHMAPGEFIKNNASAAAYKRLAMRIFPTINCALLADLHDADKRGRNPKSITPLAGPLETTIEFKKRAEQYGVLYAPEKAVLTGKDFLDHNITGPTLGAAINHAYTIQINTGVTDKNILLKKTLGSLPKHTKK